MAVKVTLLSHSPNPMELVYSLWKSSKDEEPLMTPERVKAEVDPEEVRSLFRSVIAQHIPVGESVDFVFMIEGISVSWREQAVRHRIGVTPSPERLGADMGMVDVSSIPDLASSVYWSQCFTGDTKISLLDGTEKTITELVERGEEFWVYSSKPDGTIVPGRGHSARLTKKNSQLVEVELDNGEKLRCTPDHLWMLRDGNYCEAQELHPESSLMPLYRQIDEWGYERVLDQKLGKYILTHRRVDSFLSGKLKKGDVVHHSSFNKRNNDPRKLQRLGRIEHFELHAAMIVARMESDPQGHREALSRGQKRAWERMTDEQRADWRRRAAAARENIGPDRARVAGEMMDDRWADANWRRKMLSILAQNGSNTKGRKMSLEARAKMRQSALKNGRVPPGMKGRKHTEETKRKMSQAHSGFFNHKVVAVRRLEERADVYDITVDGHHNFALSSGVFVHNSMRIQNMGKFADNEAYRIPESILEHKHSKELLEFYKKAMNFVQASYNTLLAAGIPMEDAREVIPLGATHRISWRLNISALQHIVSKRGCWILQLGIWGPVITGMIRELTEKVDPIFGELVTPPCLKGDEFTGCVYHEENARRYDGRDQHAPCPLHVVHHHLKSQSFTPEKVALFVQERDAEELLIADGVPMGVEMKKRAEDYRKFWARDPYTGKRLRVLQ